MGTRTFNGHEVAFLTGHDEDGDQDRVIHTDKLGRRSDGYEHDRVVVRHPDGKLYQFVFRHDPEHGILPCREWPAEVTEAVEVEAVEVVTIVYKVKES